MSKLPTSESDTVELKEVTGSSLPRGLWKPISAFSNADGGSIYLGISSEGKLGGIDVLFHDKFQKEISSLCSSAFNHKVYPEIKVLPKNIIQVYIPPVPATMRPIYSTKRGVPKGARVRIGTSNVQVDDEWLRRFGRAAQGGAELSQFPVLYKDYFSKKAISAYLEAVKKKRGNVYEGLIEEIILQKLRTITSDKQTTLFGLLAFSNDYGLQELTAPTMNIAITQYAGQTKVNPNDIAEVSLDDREFNGNVVFQFENAMKLIMSKLPVRSRINPGGKRQSYLAIPELAIRETLSNALAHRDYGTYQSRIQVDIYSDRIEFANPGRSLVPLDKLEQAHPQTRNPLLMSYLRDLEITEHRGRGIKTIINSLRDTGLAEPTFEHRHDWFVAILYSSAFIKDQDHDWLRRFQEHGLNERQLKALVHVRHNQIGISNSNYREINNMSGVGDDRRAKNELVRMVSLGILKKVGAKRNRRYILVQK